jgi:hypothetical protein
MLKPYRGSNPRSLKRGTVALRRLLWAASAATIIACRLSPSPGVEDITGDWEKQGQTLPPIHLSLWLERDTLRARLRLSGSESTGTARLDGRVLHVDLSGRAEQLTGRLISASTLELRRTRTGEVYRLRKTD